MLVFMSLNELRQFVQNTMVLLIDFCLKVKEQIIYVLLRLRVQNPRKKWNFLLNFQTVAYPGLLLKGLSFHVTE